MASSRPKYANPNTTTRAWLTLLALSLATALLTTTPLPPTILGGAILLLALIKARTILAHYLELTQSPAWLRGFTTILTGFTLLLFALYLI
ncbi:MAG: cytochrome C oxidase subunit IV family protein [Ruegeria sp.]|uniref:cytochrome C oxidase subunit IV family protein n=1 Tax=Ruegeria sp. TaxID=1879320 RepID=UPI00349EFA84